MNEVLKFEFFQPMGGLTAGHPEPKTRNHERNETHEKQSTSKLACPSCFSSFMGQAFSLIRMSRIGRACSSSRYSGSMLPPTCRTRRRKEIAGQQTSSTLLHGSGGCQRSVSPLIPPSAPFAPDSGAKERRARCFGQDDQDRQDAALDSGLGSLSPI